MHELRPYLHLLAARRGRLAVGALLMLAATTAAVGLLALSGWFITATAVTALLVAGGVRVMLDIYTPAGGIRFFALARTVARYFERLYNHDTVLRLLADLRASVFARLTPLDAATLARFRSAELLNRLTADINALDTLYLRALAPPLVALLAAAAVVTLLAVFAPAAALAAGTVLLAAGLVLPALAWHAGAGLGESVSHGVERLRVRLMETLHGLAELRAYGALPAQRRRVDTLSGDLIRAQGRLARRSALAEQAASLAVHLTTALVLLLAVNLYVRDAVRGPVLALMTLAVLGLTEALAPVPGAFLQLGRTRAAAARLNDVAGTRAAIVDPDRPASPPARNDLELQKVSFRHLPTAEPVLACASMTIAHGETVALVGRSGSGKSTVADLLCRLVEVQHGRVLLGGVDVNRLRLHDLHARIGYLTQRSELFADTVAGNLRLARPSASDDELWQALDTACLGDFVRNLPDALDTWVGEAGVKVSGGQARRLVLARVILKDAPVVLLDEPLAGLDAVTAAETAQRLARWLQGRTALLLAHEIQTLPPVQRVLRLQDATIER